MKNIHEDKILILDFGSQYTQLIARRVREAGVYCEIHPSDVDDDDITSFKPNGIILSGGPESVTAEDTLVAPASVFTIGVPVLGICYGMQTMAAQLGGKVASSDHREFGYAQVRARHHSQLLKDIEDHVNEEGHAFLDVWMSHGDRVNELPEGFHCIASTDNAPFAGIADEDRGFYGVQFHPEVTHTRQGQRILERFVHVICGCASDWTPGNIIEDSIQRVRERVSGDEVILGLSGGVDSSVVAALLHQAIGDQLTCVFVDNGLLRYREGDQVMAVFAENMGVKVIRVDAEQRFLAELAGTDFFIGTQTDLKSFVGVVGTCMLCQVMMDWRDLVVYPIAEQGQHVIGITPKDNLHLPVPPAPVVHDEHQEITLTHPDCYMHLYLVAEMGLVGYGEFHEFHQNEWNDVEVPDCAPGYYARNKTRDEMWYYRISGGTCRTYKTDDDDMYLVEDILKCSAGKQECHHGKPGVCEGCPCV